MADIGKVTGGSPWDEPLPENLETKKPVPAIVGDLDMAKKQQPLNTAAVEQKPQELKIPTDTEEKVGAKVNVASANPVAPATVTAQTVDKKPVATFGARSTSSGQPSGGSVDFWQSVYGSDGSPNGSATAKPSVAAPAQMPPPVTPAPATPAQAVQVPIRPEQTQPPSQPTAVAMPSAPPVAPKPVGNRAKTFFIAGILGLVIIFAGGVFLTEKGLISLGLERVYGAVRLETLWGGLPANAENAFAMSAVKMKSKKSFKVSGNATITINKGVKSDIISPIVLSAALPVISLKDEELSPKIKAVLVVVNSDVLPNDSSDLFQSELPEADQSTTSDQSSGSTSSSPSSTPATEPATGSSASTIAPDTTTIEELTTDIEAQITNNVSGANINIKSGKNTNSEIKLVYSNNKMYLKTPAGIVYDSQAKGGWVAFDLNKFSSSTPGETLWGSDFSGSGFSIVGSRGKSETIDGKRCFHYSGKATIGDALSSFSLKNTSVSSLDLDYWLGASDHLIHKLTLKIIPSSESAVTRIDISIIFSDFDSDSNDFIVPASSTSYSGSTAVVGSQSSTSATLSTEKARDSQRKADLASIAKALEGYQAVLGKYPKASGTEKVLSTSGTLYSALVPTYLATIPLDPNDPTNYYGYESNGTTYKLSSVLEDKTDASGKQVGSNFLYFLSSL